MNNITVSVIVLTYNSDINKLMRTVQSILLQKDINVELIICDDGSENNNFDKIELLLRYKNVENYRLISHDKNQGTVKNTIDAVRMAKGGYVKLISPGDYLYNEHTLKDLYVWCTDNSIKACFSEALYYAESNDGITVSEGLSHPRLSGLYEKNKYKSNLAKENYLILFDTALGAALFTDRVLLLRYLDEIDNHVIYCEDFTYRLMIADDIPVYYYPNYSVWYESETGISSQTAGIKEYIKNDLKSVDFLIKTRRKNWFTKRFEMFYNCSKITSDKSLRLIGFLLFPRTIALKIKDVIIKKTTKAYDKEFFNIVKEEVESWVVTI